MLNANLENRNDFLRTQRLINYSYEKSRLIGVENTMIGSVRFYKSPTLRADDYDDEESRLKQIEKLAERDLLGRKEHPDMFPHRFF